MLKAKISILALIAMLFSYTQLSAQENKKEFSEWPELASFHEVMSNTYHQSEESNYKPIRARSVELHDKAVKLAASTIPAGLDNAQVKRAVKELESQTNRLNTLVQKKATDNELKQMLITTHETFHKIVGLCSKGEEHNEK